ncbi:MAG: division/cell wall cluster transcriptional repressor MraZ [Microbacteriaceae bacterium]
MFSGEYELKLDDKGRMILPSKLREQFQGGLYLTRGQEGCLFVYTSAYFNDLIENMDAAALTTAEQRAFLRLFLSGAKNEILDRQGRVNIAASLRGYAKLNRELILIGVRTHLEIWDREQWLEYQAREEASFANRDGEVIPGIF